MLRYRFGPFTLSPARRLLLRQGSEIRLIPRYLDLLLFLVERRPKVVSRRDIFDRVWRDVVVSDGALTQAVRTLRRALGDEPKHSIFIRTVSRHGYQFVFEPVLEEGDEVSPTPARGVPAPEVGPSAAASDPFDEPLRRLLSDNDAERRRDAAEMLHQLGTRDALARLDARPGHAAARALLRDTRWDVAGAGPVPILGQPAAAATALRVAGLRLRRAALLAGRRWSGAAAGGALAGAAAGLLEGLLFLAAGTGGSSWRQPVVQATIGAVIGGVGAAGVGAGLSAAEALYRSARRAALVVCGALGGGAVGFAAHRIGGWTLEEMFGRDLAAVGGGVEGLVLGAAAALGYALGTPRLEGGGMAAPRGRARLRVAAMAGVCCALGGVLLTLSGGRLAGASLDALAATVRGSTLDLQPLAALLGEAAPGLRTLVVQALFEGFVFGAGLVLGLTHRPRRS